MENISGRIDEFNESVNKYEQLLRTTFINSPKNKHIQFQIVNSETERIRNEINELLKKHGNTSENLRIESYSIKARNLILKYEIVKEKCLNMDGDILFLYGQLFNHINGGR